MINEKNRRFISAEIFHTDKNIEMKRGEIDESHERRGRTERHEKHERFIAMKVDFLIKR